MKYEEIIMGSLALAWAAVIWISRKEILELAREGSRGWRNPRFLRVLLVASLAFLPAAGLWLIIARGL
ncbi:MAG: hypothetical protein WHT46_03040 [Candidatus Geothermincolales bacterium]